MLKAAWLEWRERAYDLAIEDCQKWLRTCEHLRGCNLARNHEKSCIHVVAFYTFLCIFCIGLYRHMRMEARTKNMRMYMPINMYMQNHTDAAHTKTKGAKKFQRYPNSQGRSSWSFLVSCDLANTFVRRRCRANRWRQLRQTLAQASGQRCSLQTPERTTRAANTKLGEILTDLTG